LKSYNSDKQRRRRKRRKKQNENEDNICSLMPQGKTFLRTISKTVGAHACPFRRVLPSSKIKALIYDLQFSQYVEPGVKSLVFSQFTSFMDLIEECFIHEDISYVRLDGRV